jgi:hypothetical protein
VALVITQVHITAVAAVAQARLVKLQVLHITSQVQVEMDLPLLIRDHPLLVVAVAVVVVVAVLQTLAQVVQVVAAQAAEMLLELLEQ